MVVLLPFGDGVRFERITHLSMVILRRSSFGPFPDGRSLLSHTRENREPNDRATSRWHVFVLTAGQMNAGRSRYDPHCDRDHEPETRAPFERIFSDRPSGLCEAL